MRTREVMRGAALVVMLGCASSAESPPTDEAGYRAILAVPDYLEVPAIPSANPPTAEKIALGRRLFYDRRLSGNQTMACAGCHDQRRGFADGLVHPIGSTGQGLRRNSPGLANAVYHSTFTWANNGLRTLEDQLQVPIRNDNPIELGVNDANTPEVLARFDGDPSYARMFAAAFPDRAPGATVEQISFALASFCRTLVSADSPYDRYLRGDKAAISDAAKRGAALFNGERLECFHCHSGVNLTVSYRDFASTEDTVRYAFFNNGLYNVDGTGGYPAQDQGLYDLTFQPNQRGRFRPPTLRNVAVTAPYMHDGSLATLTDVVRHYAAGGRVIATGPDAGDGRLSPLKSPLVSGFQITDDEIAEVVAFLESLTDQGFLDNPAFSDPGAQPAP
ncbi:MAG TPA: MbnH family di-heme enzyme [Kofleriaceae bacterium]